MAWLTQGLRSIESALERVDQQAATTLTTPLRAEKEDDLGGPSVDMPPSGHSPSAASSSARYTPSSAAKKEYNDEDLLDFLNDTKPNGATESVSSIRSAPKPIAPLARPASTKPQARVVSSFQMSAGEATPTTLAPSITSQPLDSSFASPSPQRVRMEPKELLVDTSSPNDSISLLDTPVPSAGHQRTASSSSTSSASGQPPVGTSSESVAALRNQRDEAEMANKLLKTQMKELNAEVQEMTDRTRVAHAAAEKAMDQVRELQQRLQEREKALVVLRRSEESLKGKASELDSVTAKNSSLQSEIKGRDAIIADLQLKMEKAKSEARAESGTKDEEAHSLLEQERTRFVESRKGFLEREAQLLSAAESSSQEFASLQRKLEEKTDALTAANAHAKEHTTEVRNLRQELTEYKSRATKVLQQREKTIEELTERLSEGSSAAASASLSQVLHLQQERDSLTQDLTDARASVEQLKQHLLEVQAQADSDVESIRSQVPALEDKLEKERKKVQTLQVELLARAADVTATKETAEAEKRERERASSELERELGNLRKIVASQKGANGASQDQRDLEVRMRTMTEHIINNQSVIDRLSSEKHSLQVQLESLQKQQATAMASQPTREDDLEGVTRTYEQTPVRLRTIASLAPSLALKEGFVSRRVFRAANALDSLSAGLGAFLRSSPTARLCLLAYLMTLHLWLFYVMFTLTPEIHRPEDLEKHLTGKS